MDKEGGEFNSELPVEAKKRKIITQNLGFNVLWAFSLSVLMTTVIEVIQVPLFGFALGAFSLIFIAAGVVIFQCFILFLSLQV